MFVLQELAGVVTGGQGCVEVAGVYTAPIALIGSEVETPLIKTGGVCVSNISTAGCDSLLNVHLLHRL